MPLLLVDMDDSLVDRTATLHRWADRHLPVPVPAADHPLWHGLARFGVHRLVTLEGAWVVGDDLRQEIAGAAKLGLRSVWLNPLGRAPSDDVDLDARTLPEAVATVLSARPDDARRREPSAPGRGRPTPPR